MHMHTCIYYYIRYTKKVKDINILNFFVKLIYAIHARITYGSFSNYEPI